MITQKELREVFVYNRKTGVFKWRHDRGNRVKQGSVVQPNTFDRDGYRLIGLTINGKRKTFKAHRLAWTYVYGEYPDCDLDHIDRDVKNNRIANLRKCTNQKNQRNTGNIKANISGVKGVCCYSNRNYLYQVAIRNGGNPKFLGQFNDLDEAVCTRLAAEQCIGWEKSESNSPAYQYVQKMLGES